MKIKGGAITGVTYYMYVPNAHRNICIKYLNMILIFDAVFAI